MRKITCTSNILFMLFSFCQGIEAVQYTVTHNKTWDNTSPLKEEVNDKRGWLVQNSVRCKILEQWNVSDLN